MADVVIKYNDTEKASMSASGTKTCQTSGKYCAGNIVVEYTRPNTSVQSKNAYPTGSDQTINPDSGYIGIAPVVVKKVTTTNLSASNIANGVTIKVGREDDAGAIASVTGTAVLLNGETRSETQSSKIVTYTPSSGKNAITSITVEAHSGVIGAPTITKTESESALSSPTNVNTKYFSIKPNKGVVSEVGWITSQSDGTTVNYKVKDGSATISGTITANPSLSSTYTSGSGYKMSVSKSQSMTPSVTEGWVSSGIAGTISVSGEAYVPQNSFATGTAPSGTTPTDLIGNTVYKLSSGYFPTDRYYKTPEPASDYTTETALDGSLSGTTYTVKTLNIKGKHSSRLTKDVTPSDLGATSITLHQIGNTSTGLYNSVTVSDSLVLGYGETAEVNVGEEATLTVKDTLSMNYSMTISPLEDVSTVNFTNDDGWYQYVYFNTSTGRATIDNLVAGNIKNGVNIFGVTGTLASGGKTGISAGGFWTTPSHTYSSTSGTIYRRTLSTTTFGGYYVLGQSSTTGTYNLYSNGYSLPKNSAIWIGRSDYKYSTSSAGSCSSGHSCNIYLYNTGSKIYILAGSQYIYGSGNISPLVDIVIGSSVSSISFTYYGGSSSSITRYSYMSMGMDVGGGSGQKEYCCIPSSASDTYTNSLKNIYYSVTSSSMSVSINMSSITWDE